jgi:hypothetical protein
VPGGTFLSIDALRRDALNDKKREEKTDKEDKQRTEANS